jgi:outer membrane protein
VAAQSAVIDFTPDYLPNYAGVGVGLAPDHIGSDDMRFGAAPVGRVSWGERYVDVIANFASANLLDHPNWRLGPAAALRLSRDDVEDPLVDRLPDIDATVEIGGFVAYSIDTEDDPRSRLRVGASVTHDVLGEHDGYVAAASVRKWIPVGRFAAFGLALGTSYGSGNYTDTYFSVTPGGAAASGLPVYEAGAGFRDIRVTAVLVQPISETFVIGAGVLYGRLLGDAADSPIVRDRGSRNQLIFGVGGSILLW